jgi:hypothetical protein
MTKQSDVGLTRYWQTTNSNPKHSTRPTVTSQLVPHCSQRFRGLKTNSNPRDNKGNQLVVVHTAVEYVVRVAIVDARPRARDLGSPSAVGAHLANVPQLDAVVLPVRDQVPPVALQIARALSAKGSTECGFLRADLSEGYTQTKGSIGEPTPWMRHG